MKIERFEDIEAWQLARELTRKVYRLTKKPGFAKDYGLKRQIQDAAGSSMHNIAEGFDSETNAEFIRFLRYAKRSCTEVQSELYVDPVGKAFRTGFSVHPSGFLVAGTLRFYMFSTLNLERRTQEPRTNTYRPTNSKMFTNRPEEHVLPFVDSSIISRNMRSARRPTVNR